MEKRDYFFQTTIAYNNKSGIQWHAILAKYVSKVERVDRIDIQCTRKGDPTLYYGLFLNEKSPHYYIFLESEKLSTPFL